MLWPEVELQSHIEARHSLACVHFVEKHLARRLSYKLRGATIKHPKLGPAFKLYFETASGLDRALSHDVLVDAGQANSVAVVGDLHGQWPYPAQKLKLTH